MKIKKFISIFKSIGVCVTLFTMLSVNSVQVSAQKWFPEPPRETNLEFETPYILRNHTIPQRGGATFQRWGIGRWDYGILSNNPASDGTPIIIEALDTNRTNIVDGDRVRIRFTNSNFYERGFNYFSISTRQEDLYLDIVGNATVFQIRVDDNDNIAFTRLSWNSFGEYSLSTLEARSVNSTDSAWMEGVHRGRTMHPEMNPIHFPYNWRLTPVN